MIAQYNLSAAGGGGGGGGGGEASEPHKKRSSSSATSGLMDIEEARHMQNIRSVNKQAHPVLP